LIPSDSVKKSMEDEYLDVEVDTSVHVYRDPKKQKFIGINPDESKEIRRLVKLIKSGQLTKEPSLTKIEDSKTPIDLWANNTESAKHRGIRNIQAPKQPLPQNEESYNPPEEYLPNEEEIELWKKQDNSLRERNFLPQKFPCLRHVPSYAALFEERYERLLDLFTVPRKMKVKMNVDPESLKVELPPAEDLRPFPTKIAMKFDMGEIEENAKLLVSAVNDLIAVGVSRPGVIKIFDVSTGYKLWEGKKDVEITAVQFAPDGKSVAIGYKTGSVELLCMKDAEECGGCQWTWKSCMEPANDGIGAVTKLHFHHKGKFLASVSQSASVASALAIHSFSNGKTLRPLSNKKSTGKIIDVKFHPTKPWLVVASERSVKVLDLKNSATEKIFKAGNSSNHLSSVCVHSSGDHYVAVSEDKRLVWFDTDLGTKPWRVLKNFQEKSLVRTQFHDKYHLLAVASMDGTVQIFHAKVFDDLNQNPLLVPVRKLQIKNQPECNTDFIFHPTQPWIFTAINRSVYLWV
jgi:ribosome biogenesis protein ERB1